MRSTPEHDRRKRNAVIVVGIAVLALAAWIGAAFALGGGSGGEEGGNGQGPSAGGEQQAQAPETTTDQPADSQGSEQNTTGEEGSPQQAAGEQDSEQEPPPTHPDVPSEPSPPGPWQQGEAPEDEEPPVANNPDSGSSGSSGGGTDESSGDDSGEAESGEAESGGEQQSMDPLGKNPEPGDLTETQTQRVKDTADRFITSAYGYTGNSREDYEQGIEQTALTHGLYRSPGGERIQEYAKAAGEDGITSAAVMDRFEITSTSTGRVEGVAYFEVGKSYNRYAELKGETTAFEQKLTLAPMQGSYRVIAAEVEQQQGGN